MLSDKCYFELAIFHRLLHQDKQAIAAYRKHQQQQRHVFNNIKKLEHGLCLDEYQERLLETEERLETEEEKDIVNLDLNDIQRLGFIPF
jgi:hypothetical protein